MRPAIKIPVFRKLTYRKAKSQASAPEVAKWRREFPYDEAAYDAAKSEARGGPIKLSDFARITKDHPLRRGKGRGENRDALARSPTGGGQFVNGGADDWSDHESATGLREDPVENPTYDYEDDNEGKYGIVPRTVGEDEPEWDDEDDDW